MWEPLELPISIHFPDCGAPARSRGDLHRIHRYFRWLACKHRSRLWMHRRDCPHLLVSSLGLSTLLHTSALAFQVIRLVGAAYLLFLAWTMWRETGSLQFSAEQVKNRKLGSVVWKAILVNLLNPKLSVFFLSFLPLFIVPSSSSPTMQFLELSSVFMLMTLGIFILYGLFAHAVSGYLIRSTFWRVWLQRGFAVIFAGLGSKLVFSES